MEVRGLRSVEKWRKRVKQIFNPNCMYSREKGRKKKGDARS